MRFAEAPEKKREDGRVAEGFVELRRVQRMPYRDAGVGFRIGKSDGPGKVAFLAPPAARGETPDAADGVTGRESGGEDVASAEDRHMLAAHVEDRGEDSQQQAALVDAGGLQIVQRENGTGMVAVVALAPVERDHEELGAQKSGNSAVGGQVGDLFRRKTGA